MKQTALNTLVVVDLEATCWEGRDHPRNEIIEIGAVAVDLAAGRAGQATPPIGEFQSFVRPHLQPELSEFCTQLTTIRQADVDGAPPFAQVFAAFAAWVESLAAPAVIGSWGRYDHNQLLQDCELHGIRYPFAAAHINLKQSYSRLNGTRPLGMKRALKHANLPLHGEHHRGIDDARNIGHLVERMTTGFGVDEMLAAGEWLDR